MTTDETQMSRRHVLAASVLAACAVPRSANPPAASPRPVGTPSIRPAVARDLPGLVELLVQGARERSSLDPLLWRLAPDAGARIEKAVAATLDSAAGRAREQWLVAERANRIVGALHTLVALPPPILAPPGPAGLLLDDGFISVDASPDTAEALLVASEAALKAAGVSALIASCPVAGRLRPLYERHGYEPVTLYLAKHRFTATASPSSVRPARVEDVPAIVSSRSPVRLCSFR